MHTPQMPSVTSFFTEKIAKRGVENKKICIRPAGRNQGKILSKKQESGKKPTQETEIREKPEARNKNQEKSQVLYVDTDAKLTKNGIEFLFQ